MQFRVLDPSPAHFKTLPEYFPEKDVKTLLKDSVLADLHQPLPTLYHCLHTNTHIYIHSYKRTHKYTNKPLSDLMRSFRLKKEKT